MHFKHNFKPDGFDLAANSRANAAINWKDHAAASAALSMMYGCAFASRSSSANLSEIDIGNNLLSSIIGAAENGRGQSNLHADAELFEDVRKSIAEMQYEVNQLSVQLGCVLSRHATVIRQVTRNCHTIFGRSGLGDHMLSFCSAGAAAGPDVQDNNMCTQLANNMIQTKLCTPRGVMAFAYTVHSIITSEVRGYTVDVDVSVSPQQYLFHHTRLHASSRILTVCVVSSLLYDSARDDVYKMTDV